MTNKGKGGNAVYWAKRTHDKEHPVVKYLESVGFEHLPREGPEVEDYAHEEDWIDVDYTEASEGNSELIGDEEWFEKAGQEDADWRDEEMEISESGDKVENNEIKSQEGDHWNGDNEKWNENDAQWSENEEVWGENEEVWDENEEVWDENEEVWGENEEVWGENEEVWSENEEVWSGNEEVWSENEEVWSENEEVWSENEELWSENEEVWSENEEEWNREESNNHEKAELDEGVEVNSLEDATLL